MSNARTTVTFKAHIKGNVTPDQFRDQWIKQHIGYKPMDLETD